MVGTRNSSRLAAKTNGAFIHSTAKATQLKALKESLAMCSKPVKTHVAKKNLMHKTKQPIGAADLKKLAEAVGLGAASARALDSVLAVTHETAAALDKALHDAT